jgi:hypothetical protein
MMGTDSRDALRGQASDCTAAELAKLLLWTLVVGYTLRSLEVRALPRLAWPALGGPALVLWATQPGDRRVQRTPQARRAACGRACRRSSAAGRWRRCAWTSARPWTLR